MGKYKEHSSPVESEYEDDDGNIYHPQENLGKGKFALARQFKAHTQSIVVLNPIGSDVDMAEVHTKHLFFKALYPLSEVHLYSLTNDYRLIIPFMPGKKYNHLSIPDNTLEHIRLYLATIEALEQCHAKGRIVIDLHPGNILYDDTTGRSYLIDGGHSAATDSPISHIFKVANETTLQSLRARLETSKYKEKYAPVAPECYSCSEILATEKMDVYSLGAMMQRILKQFHPISEISILNIACQNDNPDERPTLASLKAHLIELQDMAVSDRLIGPSGEFVVSESLKRFILRQISEDNENILMLAARKGPETVIPILNYILALVPEALSVFLQHKTTNVATLISCSITRLDLVKSIFDAIFTFRSEVLLSIVKQKDKHGFDVLMFAVRKYPIAVKPTIEAIVSLGKDTAGLVLQQTSKLGWNALMLAARKQPDAVKLILEAITTVGSDVMQQVFKQTTSSDRLNALMLAVDWGHPECTKLLLEIMCTVPLDAFVEPIVAITSLEIALHRKRHAAYPLLSNLEMLIRHTPASMNQVLKKIPLEKFERADQLIAFLRRFGQYARTLTPKESAHFTQTLSPKHWYEMASNGWFSSEINNEKRVLIYKYIINMPTDEQRRVLESCDEGPLGSCLRGSDSGFFNINYVRKLKNNLEKIQSEQAKFQFSSV